MKKKFPKLLRGKEESRYTIAGLLGFEGTLKKTNRRERQIAGVCKEVFEVFERLDEALARLAEAVARYEETLRRLKRYFAMYEGVAFTDSFDSVARRDSSYCGFSTVDVLAWSKCSRGSTFLLKLVGKRPRKSRRTKNEGYKSIGNLRLEQINKIMLLFSIPIAIIVVPPTFTQPELVITLDRGIYELGNTVTATIIGPPNAELQLELRGPGGVLVAFRPVTLNSEGRAVLTFTLGLKWLTGTYMIHVFDTRAMASATFEVVERVAPLILLAPPGQVKAGRSTEVLCFIYPGLETEVSVYIRPLGDKWRLLGLYTSNETGWLVVSLPQLNEGVYEIRVMTHETSECDSASATTQFSVTGIQSQWRVEAPPVEQLGEAIFLVCQGCDAVVARTAIGDRLYPCGARVILDVPGPWFLYPASGGALGTPTIMLVKARLNVTLMGPSEVSINESFPLWAVLDPPAPAVKINFVDSRGTVIAETRSRKDGIALAVLRFNSLGEEKVRAIPEPTSIFEVDESKPLSIRVLREWVSVRLKVLDAKERLLPGSVVEVADASYKAWNGTALVRARAGFYDVRVFWRGVVVFSNRLMLGEGDLVINTQVYDLEVSVNSFLGIPVAGELVELFNGTQRVAAGVTDKGGRLTLYRVPAGAFHSAAFLNSSANGLRCCYSAHCSLCPSLHSGKGAEAGGRSRSRLC
ncbi:MAG: hypothetical protein QW096_05785 [Thermofilaceae archaeon]